MEQSIVNSTANQLISKINSIKEAQILLVEDNPTNRMVVEDLLTSAGLTVYTADDGLCAVRMIRNPELIKKLDLIIMDLHMPNLDGYETTRIIRQDPRFHNTPIIAVSADFNKKTRQQCLAAGMNDYLSKPVKSQDLFTAMTNWIMILPQPELSTVKLNIEEPVDLAEFSELLDLFDIQETLKRLMNKRSLYKKLISNFRKNNQHIYQQVRCAFDAGNFSQTKVLVHTFKGAVGTIGSNILYNAICDIEHEIHQADFNVSKVELKLNFIATQFDLVLEAIERFEKKSLSLVMSN